MTRTKRLSFLQNLSARIQAKAERFDALALSSPSPKQRIRWAHLAQTRRNRRGQIIAKRNSL